MAKVRIVLNKPAVRALLRSLEIVADLQARGERIAASAGDGFEAEAFTGKNRGRVTVTTTTFDAILAESNDHVLTSALDAGR